MNHNPNDKFRKSFLSISMTDSEKSAMKEKLRVFTIGSVQDAPISSPYVSWGFYLQRTLSIGAMSLAVLGILSQPASAKALPGELLYPVKIAHEEIVAVTKFDSESKIKYETVRTERRIEEATQLIQEENLTAENQIIIAKSIKKHTKKIKDTITEITEQDPLVALELNSQLQETLIAKTTELKDAIIEHPIEETASPEVIVLAQALNDELNQESVQGLTSETTNAADTLLAAADTSASINELFDIILGTDTVSEELSPEEVQATDTAIASLQGTLEASPALLVSVLEQGIQDTVVAKESFENNVVETVITPVAVMMADSVDTYEARELPVSPITPETTENTNIRSLSSFLKF
jgi:hypothetical protein